MKQRPSSFKNCARSSITRFVVASPQSYLATTTIKYLNMNSCVLCKSMPCCPEHCCNWDDCTCSDCEACMPRQPLEPQQPKEVKHAPVKIILLNSQTGKPEREIPSQSFPKEESKSKPEEESVPIAAGSGVFGIRSLKKSKK